MKIREVERNFTKLCHAKPGDVVQLVGPLMEVSSPPMLLAAVANSGVPAQGHEPQGLYAEGRHLMLVDLATGEAMKMPHLSSRAVIYSKAEVSLGKHTTEQV